MSQIIIPKDKFLANFLVPLSIFDLKDKCCYFFKKEYLRGITYTTDRHLILDAKFFNVKGDDFDPVVLRDLNRLNQAFAFVEDPSLVLDIQQDRLIYDSKDLKIKSYFLDPNYFDHKIPVKLERISSLTIDTTFSITATDLNKIKKAKSFVNSEKIYVMIENGNIFLSLNDENKKIDSIGFNITDKFTGKSFDKFSLHISVFDLIKTQKEPILVMLNSEFGIVQFQITTTEYELKYITSALK